MKSHTFHDRLVAGLKASGYVIEVSNRSRFTAMKKSGTKYLFFVGSVGALRAGPTASSSYSVGWPSDKGGLYKEILRKGDEAIAKEDGGALNQPVNKGEKAL